MEGFGVPGFLLWPAIILEILLPLLIVGYKTKFGSYNSSYISIATALIFHLEFTNQMQTIQLLKNFGLAGGFIFIAINGPKDWAIDKKKKYVRM